MVMQRTPSKGLLNTPYMLLGAACCVRAPCSHTPGWLHARRELGKTPGLPAGEDASQQTQVVVKVKPAPGHGLRATQQALWSNADGIQHEGGVGSQAIGVVQDVLRCAKHSPQLLFCWLVPQLLL